MVGLRDVMSRVLSLGVMDIAIIEGARSRERQNQLFSEGKSRLKWPSGPHCIKSPGDLSAAVDAAPFVRGAISWDPRHCIHLAGLVVATGAMLGIRIRWGGNWDMDGEPITDQDFQDLVHYELVNK